MSDTATFDDVLAGLEAGRTRLVEQVLAESRAIGGYADLDPAQAADFAETVTEGLVAVLAAMEERRPLRDADVAFLWAHIRRRTQAGVAEGDMLAVVRIFQRVVWDAIFDLAGEHEAALSAALALARPLLGYVDVLSHAVDAAFSEADAAIALRASSVRRELIELLLAGRDPAPGPLSAAAGRAGLHPQCSPLVISARPLGVCETDALLVASLALQRAAGGVDEPLAVARSDEVVVIRAAAAGEVPSLVTAVVAARQQLAERGLVLAVGISTLHDSRRGIPAAYGEACLAREHTRPEHGVLAMCELGVADYLIMRGGDETAWRLVPPAVRRFVEEDASGGGVLSETLLAYVDCDLNVKLAAERLFVHPNTAHYRLARIEERTGCTVRRLADVLLLAVAVRLARTADRV